MNRIVITLLLNEVRTFGQKRQICINKHEMKAVDCMQMEIKRIEFGKQRTKLYYSMIY